MKKLCAIALVLLFMTVFKNQVGASENASGAAQVVASDTPYDECESESDKASDKASGKESEKAPVKVPESPFDKLTLKGDYFLRCRMELNRNHLKDDTDDRMYYHQRLRTHFFYQLMEEVKLEFRADWNEGAWGDDVDHRNGIPDATDDNDRALQIERALVQFSLPKFDVTLGLQQSDGDHAFGLDYIYKPQASGASIQLRLPVTIDISYYKWSEGDPTDENADTLTDSPALETDDTNLYGAQVAYKSKAIGVGLFYAAKNNLQTEDVPQAASLWYSGLIGPVQLGAEVDYFFGDDGAGTNYVGNQYYLEAAWPINMTFKVGLNGFYAMGTDKNDEEVLSRIDVWGPWVPSIWFGLPGCAWDGIEGLSSAHSFNVIGGNAGQVGGDIYLVVYAGDFEIGAQTYYFEPQEASATDKTRVYGFSAGVAYTWKKRVIFALGGLYVNPEYDDDRENEASIGGQALVRVKF